MSLFQSNLRKQIRNLPKILNFVKKIHYYSELFTSLLGRDLRGRREPRPSGRAARAHLGDEDQLRERVLLRTLRVGVAGGAFAGPRAGETADALHD